MNINTEKMVGCSECFWMGRVEAEQERCPACDDKYGLYDVTKKQYQRVTKIVNEDLPRFIKTNEYYNLL